MAAPADEVIPYDKIVVADTRPALPLGVPYSWLLLTMGGGIALFFLTFSAWVLGLMAAMFLLGRAAVERDVNRPRVWWLAITSGAALADTKVSGGFRPDTMPTRSRWFGASHV